MMFAKAISYPAFDYSILQKFRFLFLILGFCLYGVFSSPTPDNPGLIEAIIGFLLFLSVGTDQIIKLLKESKNHAFWVQAGRIVLIYGMSLPLLTGLIAGHNLILIVRDIVPFLFMLLPIFVLETCQKQENALMILIGTALFIGICFAVRVFMTAYFQPAGFLSDLKDPFYFVNAPTVLFSALLLLGLAGYQVFCSVRLIRLMSAIMLLALAIVPLAAMAMISQRASAGYIILAILIWLMMAIYKSPARSVAMLLCLTGFGFIAWPFITETMTILVQKTELVGFNMRVEEARAVFSLLGEHPFYVLFGYGWGMSFASPAVADVTVNFTHNLFTSLWLKTGFIGVLFGGIYLLSILKPLIFSVKDKPLLIIALLGPLLINMTLYASFKSLDFGIILLLSSLVGVHIKKSKTYQSKGSQI